MRVRGVMVRALGAGVRAECRCEIEAHSRAFARQVCAIAIAEATAFRLGSYGGELLQPIALLQTDVQHAPVAAARHVEQREAAREVSDQEQRIATEENLVTSSEVS